MNINIKYFGKIVEITKVEEETIDLTSGVTVAEIQQQLIIKYQALKNESFKIAVDQVLVATDFSVKKECEIALLPPFAGG